MSKGVAVVRGTAAKPTGADERTITVTVPLTLRKRGGRRHVIAPNGAPARPRSRPHVDGTLVKALARAFRWRSLLEAGHYLTVEEIARAEAINPSYVSRVLRLTLLAPDIVQAILDGRQVPALAMARLTRPFPVLWEEQVCLVASGVP